MTVGSLGTSQLHSVKRLAGKEDQDGLSSVRVSLHIASNHSVV